MSGESNCPCIVKVSTIFVFDTVGVQKAANNVYEFKKAFDADPKNAGRGVKYQFKTDFERMQYIIGQKGRVCNPPTVGS